MLLTPRVRPHFLQTAQGFQLLATRSRRNVQPQFPPQAFEMADDFVEDLPLGPMGRLYSYTVVAASKTAPSYGLAMVDFEPGVRVFGPLMLGPNAAAPELGVQVCLVPHVLSDGTGDYAFHMAAPKQGAAA
jgi:uncharacterized OB-fold protein